MSTSEWKERQNKPRPNVPYVEKCFQYAICDGCGECIPMGELAVWLVSTKQKWHLDCGKGLLPPAQPGLFDEVR